MFYPFKRRKAQSTLEYAVVIVIIVLALVAMQIFVRRGQQGRVKKSTDEIGQQYSPTRVQEASVVSADAQTNEVTTIDEEGVPLTTLSYDEKKTLAYNQNLDGLFPIVTGGGVSGGAGGSSGIEEGGEPAGPGSGGTGTSIGTQGSGEGAGGGLGGVGGIGSGGGGGGGTSGGSGGGGTSGGSGGGSSGSGSGSGGIYSSSVSAALAILQNSTAGLYFYNLIIDNSISVLFENFSLDPSIPASAGAYWMNIRDNTIHINDLLRTRCPDAAIAAIIVHEATHADYEYYPQKWIDFTLASHSELTESDLHISAYPFNSIDQEYNCFRDQILTWKEIKNGQRDTNNDGWEAIYDQGEAFMKSEIRTAYAQIGQLLPDY